MLELSQEQLIYLRQLLIEEINIIAAWIKAAKDDDELRIRRYKRRRMIEEAYMKIEAEILP